MFRAIRFLLVWYNLASKVPWFIPLQILLCEMGGGGVGVSEKKKAFKRTEDLKRTSVAEINWKITSTRLVSKKGNRTFTWRLHESIVADELIFKLKTPFFFIRLRQIIITYNKLTD